ncbi:hypothetical protein H8E52_07735 [bacterium]|nr:hypothetical protein [bacterium]
MSIGPITVNIRQNPKTGECCSIDTAPLDGLEGGDEVTWSVSDTVDCNFKVTFPDSQVFGEESFIVELGSYVTKTVATGLEPGLFQDYVIFCLMTGKKVSSDDGISPTIIIGG